MSSVPASLTYRIDDVEVDTLRNCLRRDGREIHVRPKTFQILVYLISHRDRLVSREELLEEFWKDIVVGEDVLAHSIGELRRVLNDNPREPLYLKTVPKLGYRFVGDVEEVSSDLIVATEQITTVQVREEYSDEPSRWRYSRWMLVAALVAFAAVSAATLAAWNYWQHPAVAQEPARWEVAWWKLNEGSGSRISDSVHGLTAPLPAGISWTEGISGSALFFSGRELVVRGNDRGVLPAKSSAKTLTAWIKTGTTNGDLTRILVAGDGSRECSFGLLLHENGTAAFSAPGCLHLFSRQRVDDDRWHQIAGVFEGAESRRMRLFVDGIEQASAVLEARFLSSGGLSAWTIGTGVDGGTTFRGAIDDPRIYQRALRQDEIRSLYRCLAGGDDVDVQGRGTYYFAPIFGDHVEILPPRPGDKSAGVKNVGTDLGGVVFAQREPDCGLQSVHGADVGQDMNIEVEVLVPRGSDGAVTEAGPFFRSRRANPGDGILGGTSAGFWVQLDSTGQVRVRRLLPSAVLGFSGAPEDFDPRTFHKLEVAINGQTLQVAMDGKLLTFDVAGVQRNVLEIPPIWDTVSPKGNNGGSAGIAFSNSRNRGQAGGQQARNIRIKAYQPLRGNLSGSTGVTGIAPRLNSLWVSCNDSGAWPRDERAILQAKQCGVR